MLDWIILIASILVPLVLIVAALAFLLNRSRDRVVKNDLGDRLDAEHAIDLEALSVPPRPPASPSLKVLGIDSTLAVLVLAPRGNGVIFPPPEQLHRLVDRIVPGFSRILDNHQPLFRRWEPQMSFEGFTHAFAYNLELPGDKGKGTPWSSVCGKMTVPSGQLFAGLVCLCDQPGEFGQLVVEHEGRWTETIRVV